MTFSEMPHSICQKKEMPHSNLSASHIPKRHSFTSTHNIPQIQIQTQTRFLFFTDSDCSKIFHMKTRCTSNDKVRGKQLEFVTSILPGGDWWTLPEHREDEAEPTAAILALRRMWELVADERWVAFVAVGSLFIAAVSVIILKA